MKTPNNLEVGKPIAVTILELEVTTENSVKYVIKISNEQEKLTLYTSYKKRLEK